MSHQSPWKPYSPQKPVVVPAGKEVRPILVIRFGGAGSGTPKNTVPVVQDDPFTPPSLTRHRPWSKRTWHGRLCLWGAARCARDCTQATRDTLAVPQPGGIWAQVVQVLCMGGIGAALIALWVVHWSDQGIATMMLSALMVGSFLVLLLHALVDLLDALRWRWYLGHAEEMKPKDWVEANTLLSGHPDWVPAVVAWRHPGPWRVRDLRCLLRANGEQINHSGAPMGQFLRLFRPSSDQTSLESGPLGSLGRALETQERLQDVIATPAPPSPRPRARM